MSAPGDEPFLDAEDAADEQLHGIKEVASKLGITQRTMRFYEDKGLIQPRRVGSTRVYSHREIGRMQLILRGKRLGFSLREIQDFLDLYDADPDHVEQMRHLLAQIEHRIEISAAQRTALDTTLTELAQMRAETVSWLDRHPGGPKSG